MPISINPNPVVICRFTGRQCDHNTVRINWGCVECPNYGMLAE